MSWYPPTVGSRPVLVLGAGALGRHVACVFVAGGFNVNVVDPSNHARQAAVDYITDRKDEYSTFSHSRRDFGFYAGFESIEKAARDAWLVIEARPELSDSQDESFGDLDQYSPSDCIFASTSSLLKPSLTPEKLGNKRRHLIIETRFFTPADTRVVELLTNGRSELRAISFLSSVLSQCGMIPFTSDKDSASFIFSRLRAAMKRETLSILVERLRDPVQIDALFEHMLRADVLPNESKALNQVAFDGVDTRGHITKSPEYSQAQEVINPQPVNPGNGHHDANIVNGNGKPVENDTIIYALDVGVGENLKDFSKYVTNGRIIQINPSTGEETSIAIDQGPLDGVDISESEGRLFFTSMGTSFSSRTGSVMSIKLDGTDRRTLLSDGQVCTPKQLVVAEQRRQVYFCDREGMSIHRIDFDGKNHEVLVQRYSDAEDATQWCVGITLDLEAGKMYWTQKGPSKGGQGRIFRAGIDIPEGETASNRSDIELLLSGLPEPIDLDIDVEEKVLYWTDRGEHPVGSALFRASLVEGEKWMVREQLARHLNEPIGLKLDRAKRSVYVTDMGGCVYSVNMDTKQKKVILRGPGCYTGITISKTIS